MDTKTKNNIFLRGLVFEKSQRHEATLALTEIAVLTAVVVVLQLVGSFIKFGIFSITLVLVPIVIGAALYGPLVGAWLGFVFGFVVLVSGDAAPFLVLKPVATVFTVLLKGMLAGFTSGLAYRLIEKKNTLAAVIVAAVLCPIVNTGIFLICGFIFFLPILREWANNANMSLWAFIVAPTGLGVINFPFELAINLILAPVIHKLLILIKSKVRGKNSRKKNEK